MRQVLCALVALVGPAAPQFASEREPMCCEAASAGACSETAIGLLLDASKAHTAPEAAAVRAAVTDINADLNVLPHTQLVLREPNISEFARVVETRGSGAPSLGDRRSACECRRPRFSPPFSAPVTWQYTH